MTTTTNTFKSENKDEIKKKVNELLIAIIKHFNK